MLLTHFLRKIKIWFSLPQQLLHPAVLPSQTSRLWNRRRATVHYLRNPSRMYRNAVQPDNPESFNTSRSRSSWSSICQPCWTRCMPGSPWTTSSKRTNRSWSTSRRRSVRRLTQKPGINSMADYVLDTIREHVPLRGTVYAAYHASRGLSDRNAQGYLAVHSKGLAALSMLDLWFRTEKLRVNARAYKVSIESLDITFDLANHSPYKWYLVSNSIHDTVTTTASYINSA